MNPRRPAFAALVLAALACTPPAPRPSAPAPAATPAPPEGFRHPGILVNRAQLDFIRARVTAGAEPWASAFEKARKSRWGALSWTAQPLEVVECGPYSRPDYGCTAEKDDATAAYVHALLWAITRDPAHARKTIEILNAWSAVLQRHANTNAPLQAAWTGAVFPRAAEIVRYTYRDWPAEDVVRFERMLRGAFLPEIVNGSPDTNGNWELTMAEATSAIAVFCDDRPLFMRAHELWRKRIPAYFYMSLDGPTPIPPPGSLTKREGAPLLKHWYGQAVLTDGVCQETCRDLGHAGYGVAAAVNTAETAFQQGVDLYAEQSERLRAALELNASYAGGSSAPPWLCNGAVKIGGLNPTWEIAYNHYHGRAGFELPATWRLIEEQVREHPTGIDAHHMILETLTHAGVGWVGLGH